MSSRGSASNKKLSEFNENLKLITHFRVSLRELADPDSLRLLSVLDSEAFTNADVRKYLGIRRKKAWVILSRLSGLQILEKRGYTYRMATGTYDLVGALASSLRGLVGGAPPSDSNLSKLLSQFGPEFVEWAYAKGKIDQVQFLRYREDLQKATAEISG